YGLNKRRVVKKRAAAAPLPAPGAPGAPPVCPDPKNPQCPIPAAAPVPPPTPPPQGVAVPGVALPILPDLGLVTAGLGTAPATPDVAGLIGGIVTSQAAGVGGIVPGVMTGVQGATALGGAGGGED
ncbi:hypothetical protein ABG067_008682, partial [Albugo candida]